MLAGTFILCQQRDLQVIVEAGGFQGDYAVDIWEWLKEVGEVAVGFRLGEGVLFQVVVGFGWAKGFYFRSA